ncbi:DDE_3 domain-containing protein [Trichonephila clavipes]|nr:DDE_3 domain-containing protein [Trichonephila clavipes]
MSPKLLFRERCCVYAWLMHLCRLIDNEGWNLRAITTTGRLLSGDRHDGSIQVRKSPCGSCPPLFAPFAPQDDGIYQQDNAKCHTASSVREWFEEHGDEFTVLPWPANSLKLNLIKNLWEHRDRVVHAVDPYPRYLAQLATATESAWLNIPVNIFRNLIDSLRARFAAVQ